MTPLKKNDPLLPELLKVVGCDKRALSKKQVLSLVRQGDVEALRDRLLAKKDIPPNQILFWDDLTFLSRSPRGDTKIYFAKELGHD